MSKEIEDPRINNRSGNEPFDSILDKYLSRRRVMQGGLGLAAATVFGGFGLGDAIRKANAATVSGTSPLTLGFSSVPGSMTDAVVVPEGYTAQVLVPWGMALSGDRDWSADLKMTPDYQANAMGMHHDGMYHFPLADTDESRDFLLVVNHEYIDQSALWAPKGGPTNADSEARPGDEVRTEINAHGVAVVRIRRTTDGKWEAVRGDRHNRRFTSASPMDIAGPVRGSAHVVTAYSQDGTETRGTNNNCACGYTPWGTYLTCEENWPEVFINTAELAADQKRLGMPTDRGRYGWETAEGGKNGEFARFDNTPRGSDARQDYRNEARTFGYVVEIDPYNPDSRAVKRTALGRFRHEGCWPGKVVAGEPVVFYTGHDSRNEYIYKFVSRALWDPADANRPGDGRSRLDIGAKYMNEGTLYAAKFNADGSGEWLPLSTDTKIPGQDRTLGDVFGDQAGIIINTCDAADLMGATPMDRPEWGTVDPHSGEVYMSLTNNSKRSEEDSAATYTEGGDDIEALGAGYATAPTNAANPRANNTYGHVIRWREHNGQHNRFDWTIFVFGSAASEGKDVNLSGLTADNQFASPDGLWFDARDNGQGILWIETDNGLDGGRKNAVAEQTNDQVLAVVPAALSGSENGSVVGPEGQSQLKRFAVGPNECEVTGIFATPDKTALFINLQHPGNWPAENSDDATQAPTGKVRPRASTVVIQKRDGGQIGI
ncbi:PhoX family protein [Phytohalomonas tamaricis]|uniref:PhoX family protein n=1 Tax=Phytohalomonas tamaricis TaxID=2081032 RepID=UPI000D0ADAD3|nr:PhoX family phosphatase [Phytohalomonas tamaricis]